MRYFFCVALPAIIIGRLASKALWLFFGEGILARFAPEHTADEAANVGWLAAMMAVACLVGAWAVMHVIYWYFRTREERATFRKLRRW